MTKAATEITVKQIGANGQISLGKKYAGRHVVIDDLGDGTWMVRTASVVPDSERWLHEPETLRALEEAMAWAAANPARTDNTEEILTRLEDASR